MNPQPNMDQPAQPDNPDREPPTAQILTLTQFHAALATAMLLVTTTTTTTPNHNHNHQQHGTTTTTTFATTLAYIHFWCATLGFAWWYAAQSAGLTTPGAWLRPCLRTARAG
jgi:hypothetical protein